MIRGLFTSSIILVLTVPGYSQIDDNIASRQLREKYDGYGEDWIFMPDGNGKPQVAVLKGHHSETRGWFGEPPITYILHTRYFKRN